jgi:hypothetical protein
MSLIKRKRDPEEGNIGNYIADEGSYEDRDKIMQVIRGYFWDRFKGLLVRFVKRSVNPRRLILKII